MALGIGGSPDVFMLHREEEKGDRCHHRCFSRCCEPAVVPLPSSATAHPYLRSNHGQTMLLNRSSLTIIVAGRSRFYNDNMSLMSKEGSWLTV
uniref:Uncharacterized protein n=1 Tax=Cucumis melo TaxID=3656 RepID=A0A9I9EAH5_CUCME